MKVLWEESPRPASDVAKALPQWKLNTVRTLLDRLVRKGMVARLEGAVLRFEPTISHPKCVKRETRAFVDRVFDGSVESLVQHVIEHQKVSKKQASRLKALLKKK